MTLKPAVQHRKSSFSTAGSYRIPMPVREILNCLMDIEPRSVQGATVH